MNTPAIAHRVRMDEDSESFTCLACGEEISVKRLTSFWNDAIPRRWADWHFDGPHTILDRDVRDYCAVEGVAA